MAGGSGLFMGCSRSDTTSDPPGGSTRVPLSELPPGTRLSVQVLGFPVEVHRHGDGSLSARSLMCTHTGCRVVWQEERSLYACTCHDGLYGPDGEVLAGPPPRPLPAVPVRRDGDEVVVG